MAVIKIKPLSVNEAWQGRRYKTQAYKDYEEELLWKLPNNLKVPGSNLRVFLEWGVSSKLADWDNPIKSFMDVLQKKYHFDDKQVYEAKVRKKLVKRGEEYIRFEISPL